MLQRYMYVTYLREGTEKFLSCPGADHVSLSFFRDMAFLYYESETAVCPEDVVTGEVRNFPDGSRFFPMPDIFHYSVPQDRESWARGLRDKMPWVRINRVKPEMLSRYIYFHYQYQEERPGGGPDRYGVVFLFGNYIVHYLEWPFEPELHPVAGALDTHATPADDVDVWDAIMAEFFPGWEDCPFDWHEMKTVVPEGTVYTIPANYDKLTEEDRETRKVKSE